MEQIEVNLEARLRIALPIIFEILGDKNLSGRQWKTLNKNYIREHNRRLAIYENNPHHLFEVNLYDVISSRDVRYDRMAYKFLDMLKKVLEELCDVLSPQNKLELRDTLFNVLINFDHSYRNFIGELMVLNNAVKKQDFILEKIEAPLADGKTADFLLKSKGDGNEELVEVVNIHIEEKHENLQRFITGKLIDKFNDKVGKSLSYKAFTIIPVIWGSYKDLKRLEALYENGKDIKVDFQIAPPCAVAFFDYQDSDKKFFIKFGTITTLFKGLNILEQ